MQRLTANCTLEPEAHLAPIARANDVEVCGDYLVASDIVRLPAGRLIVAERATRTPVVVPPLDLLDNVSASSNALVCSAR